MRKYAGDVSKVAADLPGRFVLINFFIVDKKVLRSTISNRKLPLRTTLHLRERLEELGFDLSSDAKTPAKPYSRRLSQLDDRMKERSPPHYDVPASTPPPPERKQLHVAPLPHRPLPARLAALDVR